MKERGKGRSPCSWRGGQSRMSAPWAGGETRAQITLKGRAAQGGKVAFLNTIPGPSSRIQKHSSLSESVNSLPLPNFAPYNPSRELLESRWSEHPLSAPTFRGVHPHAYTHACVCQGPWRRQWPGGVGHRFFPSCGHLHTLLDTRNDRQKPLDLSFPVRLPLVSSHPLRQWLCV